MSDTYVDIETYNDIYRELVVQRNSAIEWLSKSNLLFRDRFVKNNGDELRNHSTAAAFRRAFKASVMEIIDRLYPHDAIEARYDLESAELKAWSDTEANWLERELQQLQMILTKLEGRYDVQYKLVFEYSEGTLTLNTEKVLASGLNTLRTRLLTVLFSNKERTWDNSDIEEEFVARFGYHFNEVSDKTIEKAARDIEKDVAAKTGVKDFLLYSNSCVEINPLYAS